MPEKAKRWMETGHPISKDVTIVPGKSVRFVTGDGRTQFEVRMVGDTAIEVRGVDWYLVDDVMYGNGLLVEPHCSNVIHVNSRPSSGI